jgi:hypothetical protein
MVAVASGRVGALAVNTKPGEDLRIWRESQSMRDATWPGGVPGELSELENAKAPDAANVEGQN